MRFTLVLSIAAASLLLSIQAASSSAPRKELLVAADLDGDGKVDTLRVENRAKDVTINAELSSRVTVPGLVVPIDAAKQFAVCGPITSSTVYPRRESDAASVPGQTKAYLECLGCAEVSLSDGDCDPLQVYFDRVSKRLSWWRQ